MHSCSSTNLGRDARFEGQLGGALERIETGGTMRVWRRGRGW